MASSRIVVGVDGSDHSARALQWCADHAGAFQAEVIVVHVVEIPPQLGPVLPVLPSLTELQREELGDLVQVWCKPLADAGVSYRVTIVEGRAPHALAGIAEDEDAELVVTGRRGRGEFAELVLGSTSHALRHCLDRPLVIVP